MCMALSLFRVRGGLDQDISVDTHVYFCFKHLGGGVGRLSFCASLTLQIFYYMCRPCPGIQCSVLVRMAHLHVKTLCHDTISLDATFCAV